MKWNVVAAIAVMMIALFYSILLAAVELVGLPVGIFYDKVFYASSEATITTRASIEAKEWKKVANKENVFRATFKKFSSQLNEESEFLNIGLTAGNSPNSRYQVGISSQAQGNGQALTVYVSGAPSIQTLALNFVQSHWAREIDAQNGSFYAMTPEDFTLGDLTIAKMEFACQESSAQPLCITLHAAPAKTPITINAADIRQSNFGTFALRYIRKNQTGDENRRWPSPYPSIPLSEQDQQETTFELSYTNYGTWRAANPRKGQNALAIDDFFKEMTFECAEAFTTITLHYQSPNGEKRIWWTGTCQHARQNDFRITVPRIQENEAAQWKWQFGKENCAAKEVSFDPLADKVNVPECAKDEFVIHTEPLALIEVKRGTQVIRSRQADADGKMYSGIELENELITVTISKPGFLQKEVTLQTDGANMNIAPNDGTVTFDPTAKTLAIELSPLLSNVPPNMTISSNASKKRLMLTVFTKENAVEAYNGLPQMMRVVPEGDVECQLREPSNPKVRYGRRPCAPTISPYPDERELIVTVALQNNAGNALLRAERAVFKVNTSLTTMTLNSVQDPKNFRFPAWFAFDQTKSPPAITAKNFDVCYKGCDSYSRKILKTDLTSETLDIGALKLTCYPPDIAVVISGNESSERTFGSNKYWITARKAVLEKWDQYKGNNMRIYFSNQGAVTEFTTKEEFKAFNAAPDATNDRADEEIQSAAAAFNARGQDACGNAFPEAHVVYIAKNPGIREKPSRQYALHLISPDDKPDDNILDDWKTCKDAQTIQQAIETIMKGASQ